MSAGRLFATFEVMGLRGIVLCACLCGCAETELEARHMVVAPADTFWLQESRDEVTRPPLEHARSISLGYIGDGPLSGGVMRDTPMQIPAPNYVQSAPTQPPCRCAIEASRYEFEEPE